MATLVKEHKIKLWKGSLVGKKGEDKGWFDPVTAKLTKAHCTVSKKHSNVWHAPVTPIGAAALVESLEYGEEYLDKTAKGLYQIYLGYQTSYNVRTSYQLGEEFDEIPGIKDYIDFDTWRHQRAAFQFIKNMGGSLIYGGMGVGKTLITLAFIATMGLKRVLIVTPKRAIEDAWIKGAEPFKSKINLVPLLESGVSDKFHTLNKKFNSNGKLDVIVVNYEAIWRAPLANWIKSRHWDLIVADEIQKIKSPSGRASKFMHEISSLSPRRLGLSGTPCPHSPLDAYGVFRFLDAAVYGTNFSKFKWEYAITGGYNNRQTFGFQHEEDYNERFNQITLHINRNVLDLPEFQEIDRTFKMPDKARDIYDELRDELVADIAEGTVTADNALVKFLRLQQVTSGYLPIKEDQYGEPLDNPRIETLHHEKREVVEDVLNEIESSEKVAVFCRFREDLDQVHLAAKNEGRECYEISGRKFELNEWNESNPGSVIAVQIQSGGTGISLVSANYCLYYSTTLSLGDFEQSKARIHRPGQEKPVTYIYIKAENSVDTRIYEAFKSHRAVLDYMLKEI